MKTIGLIGGMSWESTIPYYKVINEVVKQKLGGLHSAKIILYSGALQKLVLQTLIHLPLTLSFLSLCIIIKKEFFCTENIVRNVRPFVHKVKNNYFSAFITQLSLILCYNACMKYPDIFLVVQFGSLTEE